MRDQPFYVEGVREALDSAGEWWVKKARNAEHEAPFGGTLYLWPNDTTTTTTNATMKRTLIAPMAQTLVRMVGNSRAAPLIDITLRGITLAHSAPTYFSKYVVPSPGDWSVHRGGAIYARNAVGIEITNCTLARLGGNGIALDGWVDDAKITDNDVIASGGSAIIIVGNVPSADVSVKAGAEYASRTLIEGNVVDTVGVFGKQSAAVFVAQGFQTSIVRNVLFNGPRAGINMNDGFGGGDNISQNVLFNWVRETRDHGPIVRSTARCSSSLACFSLRKSVCLYMDAVVLRRVAFFVILLSFFFLTTRPLSSPSSFFFGFGFRLCRSTLLLSCTRIIEHMGPSDVLQQLE